MISKEEVEKIAKLARLGLKDEEIQKIQKDLSSILDYFEKLKKVDTSKIQPTTQSILMENVERKDAVENQTEETKKNLIESTPEKEKNYIKVKSIL